MWNNKAANIAWTICIEKDFFLNWIKHIKINSRGTYGVSNSYIKTEKQQSSMFSLLLTIYSR